MIKLTLSAANMGDVIEADFDAWAAFVAARIDERTGLDVEVDQHAFSGSGAWSEDTIQGADSDERQTVREATQVIWDEFCATPAAWPNEAAA